MLKTVSAIATQIISSITGGLVQFTGPASGTTRVITVPNSNATMARTDAAQSFTGDQTLGNGNLVIGTAGKGIDFSANGGDLLSQYDEGTYVPVFSTSGGGQTVTHLYQVGQYTRVGKLVFFTILIGSSAFSGGSGSVRISLPFTAFNGAQQTAGSVGEAASWVTNAPEGGYISGNTAYLTLTRNNGSATADITTANLTTGSNGNILNISGCYMAA